MIGFDALGRMGFLGNQMFQYAALRGIAARHGYGFVIPPAPARPRRWRHHELFQTFGMGSVGPANIGLIGEDGPELELPVHGYNEDFAAACPDDVSLTGFFQAEAWFADVAGTIRADFTFHARFREPAAAYRADLGGRAIALHVRRGDYVGQEDRYVPLPPDWYAAALARLDPDATVLVFSDDPQWCREQALFAGDRFLIAAGGNTRHDLCLMSLCDDFVIANSTYSWWGAWLGAAPDKRVVIPAQWFGPTFAHLDTSGLYVAGWEAL
jgi:hypothetical protein